MPKPASAADGAPGGRLVLAASLAEVAILGEAVRRFGLDAGLDADAAADLELAVVEAANNIVLHSLDQHADKDYSADFGADADGVFVLLTDRGRPIPADLLDAGTRGDAWDESGRGLMIIRACVDRLDFDSVDGANRLRLGKAVRKADRATR